MQYRSQVYLRGDVPSKENEVGIPEDILTKEIASDFKYDKTRRNSGGLRHFLDGLVLGTQDHVEKWIDRLDGRGVYKRRKQPKEIQGIVVQFALREQRRHFEGYSTS